MSQYAALFERLRNYAAGVGPEAIEVIERIEAERDKLREALAGVVAVADRDTAEFRVARDILNPAKQANP